MYIRAWLPVVSTCFACAIHASRAPQIHREFVELHMGVAVRIQVYAADDATARVAARAAYARIAQLEDVMSDYRPASEVRRLADQAGSWVPVSEPLFAVLVRALELARRSHGAFDPTVGPYVELWRRARRTGRLPNREELDSAATRVGWTKVQVDSATRSVRLAVSGMRIDLGAIAKGYILDQALLALRRHGVTRALLQAGGDIVAGAPPPGRAGWCIEVPGAGPAVRARAAALAHAALAVSGDAEQFVIVAGVRYSHVVDPHTGVGLTNQKQAVVVAADGATADGLASALTVLDDARGAGLLRSYSGVVADVRRGENRGTHGRVCRGTACRAPTNQPPCPR
ncbi:MAG: FAD:protein FMN transferase [Gemmatimonadales bacterium]